MYSLQLAAVCDLCDKAVVVENDTVLPLDWKRAKRQGKSILLCNDCTFYVRFRQTFGLSLEYEGDFGRE